MFTPAHQQRALNVRELNYLSIDLPDVPAWLLMLNPRWAGASSLTSTAREAASRGSFCSSSLLKTSHVAEISYLTSSAPVFLPCWKICSDHHAVIQRSTLGRAGLRELPGMIIADRFSPLSNAGRLSGYSVMSVTQIPATGQLSVWATFTLVNATLAFPKTSLASSFCP